MKVLIKETLSNSELLVNKKTCIKRHTQVTDDIEASIPPPPPTKNEIKSQLPPFLFVPPREMRKKNFPLFLFFPPPRF